MREQLREFHKRMCVPLVESLYKELLLFQMQEINFVSSIKRTPIVFSRRALMKGFSHIEWKRGKHTEIILIDHSSNGSLHSHFNLFFPRKLILPLVLKKLISYKIIVEHIQQWKHPTYTMTRAQSSSNTSYSFSSSLPFAYIPPTHCRARHASLSIYYG